MKKNIKRNNLADVKLNTILENTKVIKNELTDVINTKKEAIEKQQENKNKKKEQLEKAQNKFVRVGTKLNEESMKVFNARLDELKLNQSQYIKILIDLELDFNFVYKYLERKLNIQYEDEDMVS